MRRNLPKILYHNIPEGLNEHYWHDEGAQGYWCIIKPYGRTATNIALNPSFERSANHWNAWLSATCLRTPLGAIHGNEGELVITTIDGQGIFYEFEPQFQFDTPYCASITVDGPPGAVVTFQFFHDGVTTLPTRVTLPGHPIRISCCMPATSTGTILPSLPIRVIFDRAGEYKVDGLVITEGTELITFYFDGDSPGGAWTGTPHDSISTISGQDRTLGERVDFNEIGFNIIGASGFGVSPRQLITSPFARLNGAHLQRVRDEPRIISLSGTFEGTPEEMHAARCELIDALTWRFKNQCAQEALLCYTVVDQCGCQISRELQIPVEYQSGLEGVWNTLDRERATLVFVANSEQGFSEATDSSTSFDVTSAGEKEITVNYEGNDDAWLEVTMLGGNTGMEVIYIQNLTTGHGVHFGTTVLTGNPNSLPLEPGEYAILRTNPAKRLSLDFYPGGTRIMHYIRYLQSQPGLLRLIPGENVLKTHILSTSPGSRVYVRWRNRYQSVDCLASCLEQCWESR